MTRVFRDDLRNRLIRDRLPFSTLELLVLDTAPSFALVTLFSSLAILVSHQAGLFSAHPLPGVSLLGGLLLGVAMNTLLVLCASLEGLRLRRTRRPLSYEAAVIACIVVMAAASLAHSFLLVLAVACLCVLGLISLVHFSEE
ncbi:MAG: hypothetical protein FWG23_04810 [Eggerthellaceae bacterium]|nr:hypothetical protein [Eggerthellaceae bacterium]